MKPYRIDPQTLIIPPAKPGADPAGQLAAVLSLALSTWEAHPNRALRVEVKPHRNTRSAKQNAAWWVAYVSALQAALQDATGEPWSLEEAHDWAKSKFLPPRQKVDPETGEVMTLPATTTRLNTAEFAQLMESARVWLLEWAGVEIALDRVADDGRILL